MKFFMCGRLYDTKKTNIDDIETDIQFRYNVWLGLDSENNPLFKVEIKEIDPKCYKFLFTRHYGDWYGHPECYSSKDSAIFSYDESIIIGRGWKCGTQADFTNFEHRYVISDGISDFFREYKKIARDNHASRIKELSYELIDRDNISLTIKVV